MLVWVAGVVMLLSMILCSLSMVLSSSSYTDREKMTPFECGFEPFSSSRLPFSLRFYLIALIFLIFDVEIVMLMPLVYLSSLGEAAVWVPVALVFICLLLLGLYHEWNQGALSWQ